MENDRITQLFQKLDNISDEVREGNKRIAIVSEATSVIKIKLDHINETVSKHENALYGDPQEVGRESGLIAITMSNTNKIEGVGKRLDWIRGTMLQVWTGIFAIIQLVIAGIVSWFTSHNQPPKVV